MQIVCILSVQVCTKLNVNITAKVQKPKKLDNFFLLREIIDDLDDA